MFKFFKVGSGKELDKNPFKGFYVHIPFCMRKCLYCDFCSTADMKSMDEYVNALISEIEEHKGTMVSSVFIGGGTPTVLGERLVEVVDAIKANLALTTPHEFTVEANPGTVTKKLLKKLRRHGVTRLSLGIQSFNDDELKALGRIHSAKEAKEAFYMARKAGFHNINIDLMLSTPNQTLASVKKTLEVIRDLKPDHVSAYSLIIEEGTPFYDMELNLPDEDTEREIYHYTTAFLEGMGLERYEISNFSKFGYECRHNLKYWDCDEYIGVGVAAHSYVDSYRYANTDNIKDYINNNNRVVTREFISEDEQLKEKFMLGLRKSRGVVYKGEFPEVVDRLIKEGLLETEQGWNITMLKLTDKGFDLGNLVFMEFV